MTKEEEGLIKERMRFVLTKKRMSIAKFAENNKSDSVRYGQQFNGSAGVQLATIYKMLYMFPDISADWLVMGEGAISKADCAAPRIYNTKNEVHDSKAGGDILVGATTIPCSVQSIINEKDKRIAELERDKELLSGLLSAFTKK